MRSPPAPGGFNGQCWAGVSAWPLGTKPPITRWRATLKTNSKKVADAQFFALCRRRPDLGIHLAGDQAPTHPGAADSVGGLPILPGGADPAGILPADSESGWLFPDATTCSWPCRGLPCSVSATCGSYLATAYMTSGLVAVVFSTILMWNILNLRIFMHQPIAWRAFWGGFLGLSGICLVFWQDLAAFSATRGLIGLLIALAGVLHWPRSAMWSARATLKAAYPSPRPMHLGWPTADC